MRADGSARAIGKRNVKMFTFRIDRADQRQDFEVTGNAVPFVDIGVAKTCGGEAANSSNNCYSLQLIGIYKLAQFKNHVIAGLQAGTCWINAYNLTPVEMPFGGVKQSGIGRENSAAAIEHYSQLKSVYVGMGPVEAPY